MNNDVLYAVIALITFVAFAFGWVCGGTHQMFRSGGTMDLRRDVTIALREYDNLLALLSNPPVSKAMRGTLHPATPVAGVVERSPLTLIKGDVS